MDARVVRCKIEMEFVEGRDFISLRNDNATVEHVISEVFLDTVKDYIAGGEIKDYVQAKIVEG